MINTKKVLLIILLVLIPLVAIVSSGHLILKEKKEVKGVSTKVESCVPYISNVLPRVAYVGEEYYFFPRIAGCEGREVQIEIKGVEWLGVTSDMSISGIPQNKDIGTFKIEIYTRSSTDSFKLEDYIIVKKNEE